MKQLVHRLLQGLGLDIHKYRASAGLEAQLVEALRARGIDLVFDVGAGAGQYGRRLRDHGYRGRIVSFEPLASAREQLAAAARGDAHWEVAERAALGERDGEIEIHVSANSYSSSALPVLAAHLRAAPDSRYVASERVPLRRLDGLAGGYLRPETRVLLKIDTQGFEDRVLAGAAGLLPRVAGLQLELSLLPLYEGQQLIAEMLERVRSLGYELWGAWPELIDPETGRLLQVNAVFLHGPGKSS